MIKVLYTHKQITCGSIVTWTKNYRNRDYKIRCLIVSAEIFNEPCDVNESQNGNLYKVKIDFNFFKYLRI